MKYITLTVAIAALFLTTPSCNKREIIPAPEVVVELENHFFGRIANTDVEFTQNVGGYIGSSSADFIIEAAGIDKAVYYSTMSSDVTSRSITVGHGSIEYDSGTSSTPTLSLFNGFYGVNLEPDFFTNGINGFVVKYRDASNREWVSNSNHSYVNEDVSYSNIIQESDNTGDYSKFTVNFETYVYHTFEIVDEFGVITFELDSMLVTDAVYKGWYKR